MRLIVGMTGATGAPLGISLLLALRALEVETHLVLSPWARATIEAETDYSVREVQGMADRFYGPRDQAAPVSSGSFRTDGMVVIPCSMKTLAAIRAGYGESLIAQGCGQSITAVHGAVMSRVMAVSRPLSYSASRMVAAVPSKPS